MLSTVVLAVFVPAVAWASAGPGAELVEAARRRPRGGSGGILLALCCLVVVGGIVLLVFLIMRGRRSGRR